MVALDLSLAQAKLMRIREKSFARMSAFFGYRDGDKKKDGVDVLKDIHNAALY